ncbi:ketohexokinase-like protein [Aphelenchoides avenae]|nr:ketohexokinase-like protein [Aphelenchus avenae]
MGKILLSGLCCVDIISYVERYPEEDSDNRGMDQVIALGGNAINSSVVLGQLGSQAYPFVAVPSENPLFASLLDSSGLRLDLVVPRKCTKVPMTTVITSQETGSRTVFHNGGDVTEPTADEFREKFPSLDRFSWVHFEAISVELEQRIPTEWAQKLVPHADVVFIAKDFAKEQGWQCKDEAVRGVQSRFGTRDDAIVICPWGEKGIAAKTGRGGELVHVDVYQPPVVVDTLGAGDTFIAGCLHFLNKGYPLQTALEKAVVIAGRKVGQRGLSGLDISDVNSSNGLW